MCSNICTIVYFIINNGHCLSPSKFTPLPDVDISLLNRSLRDVIQCQIDATYHPAAMTHAETETQKKRLPCDSL